jgi:hypothetical protein
MVPIRNYSFGSGSVILKYVSGWILIHKANFSGSGSCLAIFVVIDNDILSNCSRLHIIKLNNFKLFSEIPFNFFINSKYPYLDPDPK